MELEKDTLRALIVYLTAHGYPPESLAIEYPIGKYRVDLAVIDLDSKEPIALFEIKQERAPFTEKYGRKQLESFLKFLGTKSIPTYLVFVKDGTPPFEIERVAIEEKYVPSGKVLDFNILQSSSRSTLLAEIKQKRKKTVDALTAICWLMAAVLIVLLGLDAIGMLTISPVHLTIGGVIIALLLIPFASRLKIMGFEFERRSKDKRHEE